MSHNHHHSHHQPPAYDKAFAIGVALNMAFVIIEFICGFKIDSLALIADAGHNLSDVGSLILAWGAVVLSRKPASDTHTYGLKKATILASVFSAILLVFALGSIAWEAIGRLQHPQPTQGRVIIIVAAVGVVINTITALMFARGSKHDLNIRGAFLHMAADAAVSAGVVIAGALMMMFSWYWLDPVISLVIVSIIMISTWHLMRDSFNYALDGVPSDIDMATIRSFLTSHEGVVSVHDLHIWPLSTTENALTAHLTVNSDRIDNQLISTISERLEHDYHIDHVTLQVESAEQPEPHCKQCGGV